MVSPAKGRAEPPGAVPPLRAAALGGSSSFLLGWRGGPSPNRPPGSGEGTIACAVSPARQPDPHPPHAPRPAATGCFPTRLLFSELFFFAPFSQYAGIEPVDKINTEVKPFTRAGALPALPPLPGAGREGWAGGRGGVPAPAGPRAPRVWHRRGQDAWWPLPGGGNPETGVVLAGRASRAERIGYKKYLLYQTIPRRLVCLGCGKHQSGSSQERHGAALGGRAVRQG